MASYPLNEVLGCPKATGQVSQETKPRPQQHPQEALRCPRCDSSNTKFCYYNNYSLTQPRYFCKSCRRYWTKGGTLRNVPVGGGCRKNKRSSSSSSSSPSSSSKKPALRQEHPDNFTALPLPPLSYDPSDLSLAFSNLQSDAFLLGNHNPSPNPSSIGFLDILRSGLVGPAVPSPAIGGLHGLYYGFGGGSGEVEGGDNGAMLPFNHEGVSVSEGTMAEATHASAGTSHGSSYPASWQGFIIHDGA